MGVIMDILKGIAISPSIKEELLKTEADIDVLKNENAVLKAENAILKAENANLIASLQKIESGEAIHKYICPTCKQPKVKLLNIRDKFYGGQFGHKIGRNKCENCGCEYDYDIPPH